MSWTSSLYEFLSSTKKKPKFREIYELEKRKELANRLTIHHPDKVPVIVDISKSADSLVLMKCKFLAAREMTMGKFLHEIRQHIVDVDETQAIYLFLDNNVLPPNSYTMDEIHNRFKDRKDNLLYFTLSLENTFGT